MSEAWILEGLLPVRVTTAFKRLLRLDDVNVTSVEFLARLIVVTVVLRRRRLICPHCGGTTWASYDTRDRRSRWRHLDLGVWRVEIRASLRRLRCPTHGVVVEAVPFARPGAHLTRDFDDLLAWLATKMDKPRSPGCAGCRGAPSGGPANASWRASSTRNVSMACSASGSTRSRGANITAT